MLIDIISWKYESKKCIWYRIVQSLFGDVYKYLSLFNLSLVFEASEDAKDDIEDTDSLRTLDAFSAFSLVNPNTHPLVNKLLIKNNIMVV